MWLRETSSRCRCPGRDADISLRLSDTALNSSRVFRAEENENIESSRGRFWIWAESFP